MYVRLLPWLAVLLVIGCGSPGTPENTTRAAGAPLAPPSSGETIAGRSYPVEIVGFSGQSVFFQVHEPADFTGGAVYPLVIHSHGFGNARATSRDDEGDTNVGNIKLLLENNYGVISFDARGHGESGGQIRVHDPDFEIQDVMLILEWAEANLPWIEQRFDTDAGEVNMVLGSVGASYGGQFQMLLHAVDPKKRLDAIVPSNTWTSLDRSLNTNEVLKSGWVSLLFAAGNNAGSRFNFDPFVTETLQTALATNRMAEDGKVFLRYHSFDYFCDGVPVATNGGPGTAPGQAASPPTGIPALFTQGARDSLFTFNDSLNNYDCMRAAGSPDVRMMTYQSGHNTIFFGPGVQYQPSQPVSTDRNCAALTYDDAMLAFLDEHLKLQAGRANAVLGNPDDICLSMDVPSGVVVSRNQLKLGGQAFNFTDEAVLTTVNSSYANPLVVGDIITIGTEGAVVAGIPTADITLTTPAALGSDPIVLVGIGHRRASGNGQGVWDTIDNQVIPIRGPGQHQVDLTFIAEQLNDGDEVAVLLFSTYLTHQFSTTRDPLSQTMLVSGSVNVPILTPAEYRPAP